MTRVTTSESTSAQAGNQLASPAALSIASGILIFLGCIPRYPFIFLSMGGVLALISYFLKKSQRDTAANEASLQEEIAAEEDRNTESEELDWSHIEQLIKLVWKLVMD